MAFLLLCGYPPFFAPSRAAALARISKTDFAFDPPFWSKISEEGKDFVQLCLRAAPERRLSVHEALQHPWIETLADNAPFGCMLSSFASNLLRFYRTSVIEMCVSASFAVELNAAEMAEILARCTEADTNGAGFLTATDLREVLLSLGYEDLAKVCATCCPRKWRHPADSYLDYAALLESAQLRKEWHLEEDLWDCFVAFKATRAARPGGASEDAARLSRTELGEFFQSPDVQNVLDRNGVEVAASSHLDGVDAALGTHGQVGFVDVAGAVIRRVPVAPTTCEPPVTSRPGPPGPAPASPPPGAGGGEPGDDAGDGAESSC